MNMRKIELCRASAGAAIAMLLFTSAASADDTITDARKDIAKANYESVLKHAEANYETAKAACGGMPGNDKDACEARAEPDHGKAKAQAQAERTGAKANADASEENREADYDAAKKQCETLSGDMPKMPASHRRRPSTLSSTTARCLQRGAGHSPSEGLVVDQRPSA